MCPLFSPRVRSCWGSTFTAAAAFVILGSVALGAASPGAAFQELPDPSAGIGLTLQMAASTAGVLSRITAIPEPASCLLFGTSVFGLLAVRRRLRQRS